ncbi:MAG: threonylcarbamoyl-AMP synthase [Lautropia sp.]|nr:MAG: threonylcarbamoyl-AMP synthase [Pseudomonadota bacterium]MBC6959488.1 threonylcarbamoyl-AMP synthase [Lautropia sp.]MCL4702627.1 threonylcarbamoyl-AMP synthase [Burkholderiaceae bacterium]MCZ2415070.1 threonylcarbamoyl-AMP synthase [Burkholderiales bacterium]MDL1906694.1 threonylcarbamoyl-AMP synthase [Betaproteobacteria bacterium PRO1]
MNVNPRPADAQAIEEAARRLAGGELVAFPTETVYGLGADAASARAIAEVYRLKGRPADHPLIVHVLDAAQAAWWAHWPARAQRLADAFWPGPLTLVLVRRETAPAFACGGQVSIGLRAPSHPVARALLAAFAARGGHGVAAPSANRFGRVSPTRAVHVIDDLGVEAPLVLDGGACEVGVESTIVDLSRERPVLLRPGGITIAQLEAVLGEPVPGRDARAPRASGTLEAHYAPVTPVELVDGDGIDRRIAGLHARGERVALWVRSGAGARADARLSMPADPTAAAHALYDALRTLDRSGCTRILVERVPGDASWHAVADRLRRSAAGPGGVAEA